MIIRWLIRDGSVFVWESGVWSEADPQPARVHRVLAGTVCAVRGHHTMSEVDARYVSCEDCGYTVETEEEDGNDFGGG